MDSSAIHSGLSRARPARERLKGREEPGEGSFRPRSSSLAARLACSLLVSAVSVLVSRNLFGTEKKIRHKIVADYDAGDPTFARTISDLFGPPLLRGNSVKMLQNGEEIFPDMLAAIGSAQRTITFENFVFSEGRVSNEFAEAMAERARAGVKVHFLQDAMGCNCLHGRAMNLMRRAGVEVEIFRFFKLTRLNYRTHRKLLVIDGRLGFIGGVGISDDWSGDGKTPGVWRDTQYRVEGPVVAQAQQAFLDNWMETRAAVLHGDAYFPELAHRGEYRCQVFKSSASEGAESARLMFLLSVATARRRIQIANAYFIPDDLCRQTLVEACQRGVAVEVITPGADIDQQLVRVVGRERWGPLLKAGARFFEYQPARFHCKYIIVDDCWCSVGSANLDNRSLRLNEEANLNILDTTFAAEHARVFEMDKSQSREVTHAEWLRRPFSEKMKGRVGGLLRSQM
jgi:cardiolipin synthase A/B